MVYQSHVRNTLYLEYFHLNQRERSRRRYINRMYGTRFVRNQFTSTREKVELRFTPGQQSNPPPTEGGASRDISTKCTAHIMSIINSPRPEVASGPDPDSVGNPSPSNIRRSDSKILSNRGEDKARLTLCRQSVHIDQRDCIPTAHTVLQCPESIHHERRGQRAPTHGISAIYPLRTDGRAGRGISTAPPAHAVRNQFTSARARRKARYLNRVSGTTVTEISSPRTEGRTSHDTRHCQQSTPLEQREEQAVVYQPYVRHMLCPRSINIDQREA